MRILFFTDTHLRGNNPESRKDDFPATLKRKLAEVVAIASDYQVDLVIHGGDVFDIPVPSLTVTASYFNILQKIPAPIYAIAGNHDIFAHNPATLERTMLGFIAGLGLLHLLVPGEKVYIEKKGIRLQLTGQHYHYDIDARDPALDYMPPDKKDCDVAVHVVHGMLLDKPFPLIRHTLVEQIVKTPADITLCGHNHIGFADVVVDGKYFLNCGALVRLSNHPEEIKRWPQVLIIDLSGGGVKRERVRLQSALPGEEVLDREKIRLREEKSQRLAEFIQALKQEQDLAFTSVNAIVNAIAQQEGLEPAVREEALKRIAAAQERLGG